MRCEDMMLLPGAVRSLGIADGSSIANDCFIFLLPVRVGGKLETTIGRRQSPINDELLGRQKVTRTPFYFPRASLRSCMGLLQIDIASVENHQCRELQVSACDVGRLPLAERPASSTGSDGAT